MRTICYPQLVKQYAALAVASVLLACSSESVSETHPNASALPHASQSASVAATLDAGVDIHTHASPHDHDSDGGTIDEPIEPVITDGSVDGAKLRARISRRLQRDTSPVVVLRGTSPSELGRAICERVVPRRPATTPILVKPNLGGFDWFKDPAQSDGDDGFTGRITNPEFVRGVLSCLKARGHENITLADGWSAKPKHWAELLEKTGYGALAKEMAVRIVGLADDGHFDTIEGQPGTPLKVTGMERTRTPNLLMPKIVAEHLERGLVISIPKLKAHRFAVMSGGIKGLQGTIMLSNASPAYRQKWRMHAELQDVIELQKKRDPAMPRAYVGALNAFAARIADVLAVEAPDVVLMDAAPAMSGDGFHEMVPSAELLAVGGTNPIAVDRVGAELLGLWKNRRLQTLLTHATSPLITVAAKKFGVDLDAVKIEGNGASLLAGKRATQFSSMAGFVISEEAIAPRIATARKLGTDRIVVDGKADDAIWSKVQKVSFQTDFAGTDRGVKTTVRFAWAADALYAFWDLEQAALNTDTSRPTTVERSKLYQEDCVELFIDPTPDTPRQYLEIQAGPFGHFGDVGVDLATKSFDESWSGQLEVAAVQDVSAKTATIEMAIRAPAVRNVMVAGKRFPLALYRMEGKGARLHLAWSPPRTKRPNFHIPEAFGELHLAE